MKPTKRHWIGLILIGLSIQLGVIYFYGGTSFIFFDLGHAEFEFEVGSVALYGFVTFLATGLACFFWPVDKSKNTPVQPS